MQVSRIDHVHIEVFDREAAADWYERVLGLKRHDALSFWAEEPMGPLVLQGGDGFPALSLFARGCKETSRDNTVAFRFEGKSFLDFCDNLEILQLKTKFGGMLTRADIVDHEVSWSFYFLDPDQNLIEVTTYDYSEIQQALF